MLHWSLSSLIADRKKGKNKNQEVETGQHVVTSCLSHRDILAVPAKPQLRCQLLGLPAEIRKTIYSLVLTDGPDPDPANRYSTTQIYHRPGHSAPRKTDISLLSTCRAVYAECWHLPNMLREQVFWFTPESEYRGALYMSSPPNVDTYKSRRLLVQTIRRMKAMHGVDWWWAEDQYWHDNYMEQDESAVETAKSERRSKLMISQLSLFTTPWKLESHHLHSLLATEDFYPQRVTLTIRHTDWPKWETDQPLSLKGGWIMSLDQSLSPSTREIVIELETVARKKDQVEYIAAHITRHWFFRRRDGVVLYPDATEGSNHVTRWEGRSTYNFLRWTRDETKEGIIEYHVVSVPFREQRHMRAGAAISEEAKTGEYNVERLKASAPGQALAFEPGTAPWVRVPWEETDQLGAETKPQPHVFAFGWCGNCNRPAYRSKEHPYWDRW